MKTILVGFILGIFYLFSDRILEIRKNVIPDFVNAPPKLDLVF